MLNYGGSESQVKEWMSSHAVAYIENGKVNCTRLAEDAWDEFESGEEIHPDFFEYSYEVAQEVEREINRMMLGG